MIIENSLESYKPIEQNYKSSPKTYQVLSKRELSQKRILVIDSDVVSNGCHCLFLTKLGIKKIEIKRLGVDAITSVAKIKYSLILIEPLLSDINGFKVCKEIIKSSKNRNTPIIAATSFTKKKIIDTCNAYNIFDVITKPLLFDEYKNIVYKNLIQKPHDTNNHINTGDI